MLGELDGRDHARRAPRRAGRRGGHRLRERCVGPVGGEREMAGAQLLVGDRFGQRAVDLAPLAPTGPAPAAAASSGCDARSRSPVPISSPASSASSTGVAAATAASSPACRSPLSATASSARRTGSASRRDARAQQLLHALGHRHVGGQVRHAALEQHAALLERE